VGALGGGTWKCGRRRSQVAQGRQEGATPPKEGEGELLSSGGVVMGVVFSGVQVILGWLALAVGALAVTAGLLVLASRLIDIILRRLELLHMVRRWIVEVYLPEVRGRR